jgi:transketolase
VEHLASLRAMPGLRLIRPADANETVQAWREAIIRTDGPTMLVLSRQKLPVLDQNRYGSAVGVSRGAYILADANGEPADILLISTGSEVHVTLAAAAVLSAEGINAWVVSMPSWELFREQNQGYRDDVLPPAVKRRLAVEAGVTLGWKEWVGDEGDVIGMEGFGASAPAGELFSNFGFSVDNVVARARALLED